MGYLGLIDIISLEEHSKYNFFFQMRTSFTFPLSIVILLAIEEKKAKEQAWKKKKPWLDILIIRETNLGFS